MKWKFTQFNTTQSNTTRRLLAVTIIVNEDHVTTERLHIVECFATIDIVTVEDQLAVNTVRLAMLLSLMSNQMILAVECLVTVFILT